MSHKHADVIHAWAEGAKIEMRVSPDSPWELWHSDSVSPSFFEFFDYRIAEGDEVLYEVISKDTAFETLADAMKYFHGDGDHLVKLTISRETGLISNAEEILLGDELEDEYHGCQDCSR